MGKRGQPVPGLGAESSSGGLSQWAAPPVLSPVRAAQQVKVGRAVAWRGQEPHHLWLGESLPPSRAQFSPLLNGTVSPELVHSIVEVKVRTDRKALKLKPHASRTD